MHRHFLDLRLDPFRRKSGGKDAVYFLVGPVNRKLCPRRRDFGNNFTMPAHPGSMHTRCPRRARRSKRWGVILAGGDGTRLLSLTRALTGDDTPKQFCALTGGDTLLQQTRRRIAGIVPDEQTLLLLTEKHRRFFTPQLADVPAGRMLIQPWNHGTAPAIAWSLVQISRMNPDAIVGFFPSDHHFGEEEAFTRQVDEAFDEAASHPDRVLLLGVAPDAPEESYGWIEPGLPLADDDGPFEVRRFWEKPSQSIAASLMHRGCLWNSFVMAGSVRTFLQLLRETLPELVNHLESVRDTEDVRRAYASLPASNFSTDVLSAHPGALAVIRATGLEWSDLGEPQRVFSLMQPRNAPVLAGAF
jgi:mannose-1-phosphate guanylyltransferase